MPRTLYADYNATTPPGPAAIAAMTEAFGTWGNASSAHAIGRKAAEPWNQEERHKGDEYRDQHGFSYRRSRTVGSGALERYRGRMGHDPINMPLCQPPHQSQALS